LVIIKKKLLPRSWILFSHIPPYIVISIYRMGAGEKTIVYGLLVGKPEGERPLARPRRRWVDNIKMDLGDIKWGGVNLIGLPRDRHKLRALVNSVMNVRVP
jgi:hypothetical protein